MPASDRPIDALAAVVARWLACGGARRRRAARSSLPQTGEELDQGQRLRRSPRSISRSTPSSGAAHRGHRRHRLAVGGNRGRSGPARRAPVWIVDPIDGTRAYIAGRPDWTISVALVEDGRPVVAALYAPASEEFFVGGAGGGVTRNGIAIEATAGEELAGARVAGPATAPRRLAAAAPHSWRMPRVHSLALRLARVADGTSTSLSPAATATTGTLPPPIFWCTKPAAL